jgi:hypothetical protein
MKIVFWIPFVAALIVLPATCFAQDRIYRCGNEYTNTVSESQAQNCKLISGGNVTVVQAHKPAVREWRSAVQAGQRVDGADQRAKDSDYPFDSGIRTQRG